MPEEQKRVPFHQLAIEDIKTKSLDGLGAGKFLPTERVFNLTLIFSQLDRAIIPKEEIPALIGALKDFPKKYREIDENMLAVDLEAVLDGLRAEAEKQSPPESSKSNLCGEIDTTKAGMY